MSAFQIFTFELFPLHSQPVPFEHVSQLFPIHRILLDKLQYPWLSCPASIVNQLPQPGQALPWAQRNQEADEDARITLDFH
jgi:hypothetical protein